MCTFMILPWGHNALNIFLFLYLPPSLIFHSFSTNSIFSFSFLHSTGIFLIHHTSTKWTQIKTPIQKSNKPHLVNQMTQQKIPSPSRSTPPNQFSSATSTSHNKTSTTGPRKMPFVISM